MKPITIIITKEKYDDDGETYERYITVVDGVPTVHYHKKYMFEKLEAMLAEKEAIRD
jgi:hypothetical protein